MVKLNNKKISFMVKAVTKEKATTRQIAELYSISQRRVQQLAKKYQDNKEVPKLNWNRRPKTELTAEQKKLIEMLWQETKRGARMLWLELKEKGHKIPKNKIHHYLKTTGRSVPNKNKQKKRKRCRYEREHSGSLLHGDWHRTSVNHPYAIAWEDDSSRKILSCGEFSARSAEKSIQTLKQAVEQCRAYMLEVKQVNTDRGTEFFSDKGKVYTFGEYLKSEGIEHVPSRVKNPQTNGKIERFWYEYDKHRWRFNSFQEYINWYNSLIHGEIMDRPERAFKSKLPPECLLGLFSRLVGW